MTVLTEVHLVEESYVQDSLQEVKAERRIRRCFIDDEGFYSVEVYRVPTIGGTSKIELMATYRPLQFGNALTEIPFTFINPNSLLTTIEKPPMLDIALMSLAVYRNSADLEQILHTLAMPTPYGTGMEEEDLEGSICDRAF